MTRKQKYAVGAIGCGVAAGGLSAGSILAAVAGLLMVAFATACATLGTEAPDEHVDGRIEGWGG